MISLIKLFGIPFHIENIETNVFISHTLSSLEYIQLNIWLKIINGQQSDDVDVGAGQAATQAVTGAAGSFKVALFPERIFFGCCCITNTHALGERSHARRRCARSLVLYSACFSPPTLGHLPAPAPAFPLPPLGDPPPPPPPAKFVLTFTNLGRKADHKKLGRHKWILF